MQKKHSRLMLAAASILVGALGITGCAATGAPADSGEKQTVVFWQQQMEDFQQAWYKKTVDAYNASQDKVEVKLEVIPGDAWPQKLATAQAAGLAPDVMTINYGKIGEGVPNGEYLALDDLMPAASLDDLKPNIREFVTIDDKAYAYPVNVEASKLLYYRTDLVKAAGLDPNSPPKTWDDLIVWAKALNQGNVQGIAEAANATDLSWSTWGLQWNACDHAAIDDDWAEGLATDPCFQKLAEFYRTLYTENLMPQNPKTGYSDPTPYINGEVAMMDNGSWAFASLKADAPDVLANTAVAAFPSMDGAPSRTTATLGGWALAIDAKSKVAQPAADFVNWLAADGTDRMVDYFTISNFARFTARTSVEEALKGVKGADDPIVQTISNDVVSYAKHEPAYPFDISMAIGTAIETAMKTDTDLGAAFQTADDSINDVIAKQSLAGANPFK